MGDGVFRLFGEHVRAGRALLRWKQPELAAAASKHYPVSPDTIKAWEAIDGPIKASVDRVEAVIKTFQENDIELLNGDAPGARRRPKA